MRELLFYLESPLCATRFLNSHMAQHLQCESLTLVTIDPGSPALVPGAVVVCAAPLVVELPVIEYTVAQIWADPQNLPLLNTLVLVADFRGPPMTHTSTRHTRLSGGDARGTYGA